MTRLDYNTRQFREPTANEVPYKSTGETSVVLYRGLAIEFDDNQLYTIRGLGNQFNKLTMAKQFIDAAFAYGEEHNV